MYYAVISQEVLFKTNVEAVVPLFSGEKNTKDEGIKRVASSLRAIKKAYPDMSIQSERSKYADLEFTILKTEGELTTIQTQIVMFEGEKAEQPITENNPYQEYEVFLQFGVNVIGDIEYQDRYAGKTYEPNPYLIPMIEEINNKVKQFVPINTAAPAIIPAVPVKRKRAKVNIQEIIAGYIAKHYDEPFHTSGEIAKILGCSEKTVRNNLIWKRYKSSNAGEKRAKTETGERRKNLTSEAQKHNR